MRRNFFAGTTIVACLVGATFSCQKDNPAPNTSNTTSTIDSTSTGNDTLQDSTYVGGGCGANGNNYGDSTNGWNPTDTTIYTNPYDSTNWNP